LGDVFAIVVIDKTPFVFKKNLRTIVELYSRELIYPRLLD